MSHQVIKCINSSSSQTWCKGLLNADHKCDRVLAHTGTCQVGLDRIERLTQHLIPDVDLYVWGGFRGLQPGSNEAAPVDLEDTQRIESNI